jgi:beta-lactamase regulating signal transducer with metallopeptidase domain
MIFYVGINLGLAAVFLFVRLVLSVTELRAVTVSFRNQLFISRALLCATLVATISAILLVRQADLRWSLGVASFEDAHSADGGTFEPFSDLSVANLHFPGTGRFSPLMSMLFAALLAVALIQTLRTILQYREVAAVLRSSVILRRHKRAVIVVSDRIGVPFSLRTLRSRWVVLPSHLLGHRQGLRFAVGHELQHHRQGDTSWAWVSRALCIVFWPNPVVRLWQRWHDGVQELACDEALLQRPGFEVEEYARCLLDVAERALTGHQAFQFAPSMAAPRADRRATVTHLQKRIEMLFASSSRHLSRPLLATAVAAAICCGVSVSALAAGLTSASRENAVDVAAQEAADDTLPSSAVERGTTSAEPDCEHHEGSCPESPTALTSSEPLASSDNACTNADALQQAGESHDTQSTATEPDCPGPSDHSSLCAE